MDAEKSLNACELHLFSFTRFGSTDSLSSELFVTTKLSDQSQIQFISEFFLRRGRVFLQRVTSGRYKGIKQRHLCLNGTPEWRRRLCWILTCDTITSSSPNITTSLVSHLWLNKNTLDTNSNYNHEFSKAVGWTRWWSIFLSTYSILYSTSTGPSGDEDNNLQLQWCSKSFQTL